MKENEGEGDNWQPIWGRIYFLFLRDYEQKIATEQFYGLFSADFRDYVCNDNIVCLKAIFCYRVDSVFEGEYGDHGSKYNSNNTAFLFSFLLTDNSIEEKHFCLGHLCGRGCRLSDFSTS